MNLNSFFVFPTQIIFIMGIVAVLVLLYYVLRRVLLSEPQVINLSEQDQNAKTKGYILTQNVYYQGMSRGVGRMYYRGRRMGRGRGRRRRRGW